MQRLAMSLLFLVFMPKAAGLTDCLTSCNEVLLQKLAGPQPVNKFSAFYGNRRLITRGVERPGHETDKSLSSSAEIKST